MSIVKDKVNPRYNRPMMCRKPGCLNDIAKKRQNKSVILHSDAFDDIERVGVISGRLVRNRGGVQTYLYR